ncbi:hypothetical protein Tco_0475773 [Tanacetum coccineum]
MFVNKTFNVFKNESKEKEAKNIDTEIALEKKVKELNNIVCKMGQFAQIVHMFTKPQVFYDNNVKQALGNNVISIVDSEVTLMLEEESRSKMILKQNFGKRFVPQRELFKEQALHLITDQSASSLVKIEAPRELPKQKNDLRKFKGKYIVDNATQVSNTTTIALGIYKLDPVILAPKVKNNREAHEYCLKHTMEQAAILREIVEQAKSQNTLV